MCHERIFFNHNQLLGYIIEKKIVFILILFFSLQHFAQNKSNLEIIYSLLNQSVINISNNLIQDGNNAINLEFDNAKYFSVLKPAVIDYFQQKNISISNSTKDSSIDLNYFIEDIKVDYPNTFRDGIFGKYLAERKINLKGNYFLIQNDKVGQVNAFEYSNLDTIPYNEIPSLENIAYTFTTSKIPEEPFFSSLLEPVIVVGASAVAIYLFFTVRSN